MSRSIEIPIRDLRRGLFTEDEVVEIKTDQLPDGDDVLFVLRHAQATLNIWVHTALEYYRQGKVSDFVKILDSSRTEADIDYPNVVKDQMDVLDKLSAYYLQQANKEKDKEKKRELFTKAEVLYSTAGKIMMYNGGVLPPENEPHQESPPVGSIQSSNSIAIPPGNEDEPLAFLRPQPQFQLLCQVIQQNPQLLNAFLQKIEQTTPQLLLLISQNQEEFVRMLIEPQSGGGSSSAAGGSGGSIPAGALQGSMPLAEDTAQVLPQDRVAIERRRSAPLLLRSYLTQSLLEIHNQSTTSSCDNEPPEEKYSPAPKRKKPNNYPSHQNVWGEPCYQSTPVIEPRHEDYSFLVSLLPNFKEMSPKQKMAVKIKMMQEVYNAMFDDSSIETSGSKDSSVDSGLSLVSSGS